MVVDDRVVSINLMLLLMSLGAKNDVVKSPVAVAHHHHLVVIELINISWFFVVWDSSLNIWSLDVVRVCQNRGMIKVGIRGSKPLGEEQPWNLRTRRAWIAVVVVVVIVIAFLWWRWRCLLWKWLEGDNVIRDQGLRVSSPASNEWFGRSGYRSCMLQLLRLEPFLFQMRVPIVLYLIVCPPR